MFHDSLSLVTQTSRHEMIPNLFHNIRPHICKADLRVLCIYLLFSTLVALPAVEYLLLS